ncbi:hypothetical protein C0992_013215, partial [Termitomyces sp. T32_za158]
MSSTSSAVSMSPNGLAAVFGDFTLVDEQSPDDSYPWTLEQNVSRGQSSLSSGGNASSEGLNLTIPNDPFNDVYSLPATQDEDFNEIFNQTISLNFEELDNDPSPSRADLGSYLSPQHSESTSAFFVPHSPVPSVPNTLTSAVLLPTTSNVDEDTLQHRYRTPREIPGSPLLRPDGHEDNKQLCRHNRSHSNSCVSSSVGGPLSSSLLSPDAMLAE